MEETKKEEKRISLKLYIKREDSLKMERVVNTLKQRGWRRDQGSLRIQNKILDELFLKADSIPFMRHIINRPDPSGIFLSRRHEKSFYKKRTGENFKKKNREKMSLTIRDKRIISVLQNQDFCFYKDIKRRFFCSNSSACNHSLNVLQKKRLYFQIKPFSIVLKKEKLGLFFYRTVLEEI